MPAINIEENSYLRSVLLNQNSGTMNRAYNGSYVGLVTEMASLTADHSISRSGIKHPNMLPGLSIFKA